MTGEYLGHAGHALIVLAGMVGVVAVLWPARPGQQQLVSAQELRVAALRERVAAGALITPEPIPELVAVEPVRPSHISQPAADAPSRGDAAQIDPQTPLAEDLDGPHAIIDHLLAEVEEDLRQARHQAARTALSLAGRVYLMERGQIVHEGTAAGLRADAGIVHRYLGVSLKARKEQPDERTW